MTKGSYFSVILTAHILPVHILTGGMVKIVVLLVAAAKSGLDTSEAGKTLCTLVQLFALPITSVEIC